MGELSAIAQDLKVPITSGEKVRNHSGDHSVYLLLDRDANGGLGSVVGLLKVGRKNLFLLDRNGDQNEVCPTCILDFYVHESRQRSGCGKLLFQHMLKVRIDFNYYSVGIQYLWIIFRTKTFNQNTWQ